MISTIALIQGTYYFLTGVWPLFSIKTFEKVSGPKTDDWLVQTVGLLIAVSGAVFLYAGWNKIISTELMILAVGDALALMAVDCVFVSLGQISRIYLLDALAELILVFCWLWFGAR